MNVEERDRIDQALIDSLNSARMTWIKAKEACEAFGLTVYDRDVRRIVRNRIYSINGEKL